MSRPLKLSLPAFTPTLDFLMSYDHILVAFSGGRDPLASVLHLLELGVPAEKIELHHQLVDGDGPYLMDWPITIGYCRAIADLIGIKLVLSYREGGMYREMMRDAVPAAPVQWQDDNGDWHRGGGVNFRVATRMSLPPAAPNRKLRWCRPYLKNTVMHALLSNDERFQGVQTLVVSGERQKESAGWGKLDQFGPHYVDNRLDPFRNPLRPKQRFVRHIDHWRPMLWWSAGEAWDLVKASGIVTHPCYRLGFPKLGCLCCSFGTPDQWATVRYLYPDRFEKIRAQEAEFGVTIRADETVDQTADRGRPYPAAVLNPDLAAFANQPNWYGPIIDEEWRLPAGATEWDTEPC